MPSVIKTINIELAGLMRIDSVSFPLETPARSQTMSLEISIVCAISYRLICDDRFNERVASGEIGDP